MARAQALAAWEETAAMAREKGKALGGGGVGVGEADEEDGGVWGGGVGVGEADEEDDEDDEEDDDITGLIFCLRGNFGRDWIVCQKNFWQ